MDVETKKKKISDILFNALTQEEKITKKQEDKIKEEIFEVLES